MFLKKLICLLLTATAWTAHAGPGPVPSPVPGPATETAAWLIDPTDAIMQAAATKGDALIWFTRDAETESFAAPAGDTPYARCRIRYPQRSFERPAEAQWFIAWANRFAVEEIPSVVLIDGHGRPYARLSGTPDATAINTALHTRTARDTALAAADATTGQARARHLGAALQAVGPYAVRNYRELAQEVVALDPDNAAGLRALYAPQLAEKVIDEVIQGDVYPLIDAGAYPQARQRLSQLQAALPGLSAEQRQTLTAFRAQLLITEGNPADARTLLKEALALAPASDAAEKIREAVDRVR